MAKTRQQKEDSVAKLSEQLSKAKSVVFADYKGLSMKQLSNLRDQLREVNGEFTITKNTLLQRALPTTNYQLPTELEGPTATLFAYDDEISPIKILVKTLKDVALGKIKSGFFGGTALDEGKILQLAALPTKLELKGQIVGILAAPLQGMVSVLNGNLRNLVYALNQIKISKGGE
ncbi:MAG: 50S ribosomal protein L10 [Candidatus Daviesbacteria bacterium]|nr:50S ribosomal protein L10 [Candidatus Daviesbacteria bacterium]